MEPKKGLMLILNGKKPPMEEEGKEESSEDMREDVKEDAGRQLSDALDSGSGQAVYNAIIDIIKLYND